MRTQGGRDGVGHADYPVRRRDRQAREA
jgi:hypothetical protein